VAGGEPRRPSAASHLKKLPTYKGEPYGVERSPRRHEDDSRHRHPGTDDYVDQVEPVRHEAHVGRCLAEDARAQHDEGHEDGAT
jgi:hypothetical protein